MKIFHGYFKDLHFTESKLWQPMINANLMVVEVTQLYPLEGHPLCKFTNGPVAGKLIFNDVSQSERTIIEYKGDSHAPTSFKEKRKESDGPFNLDPFRPDMIEFGFEGFLENPPAWVDDWIVKARSFALEVTHFNSTF